MLASSMLNGFQEPRRKMEDSKGMRFPMDVILMCIRWYVAYPLSYRHVEKMMGERGVNVFLQSTDGRSDFCRCWKKCSENTNAR